MPFTLVEPQNGYLKSLVWTDDVPLNGGYSKERFYSKGTVDSQSATGPMFAHRAMLMHAGGFYQPYSDTIVIVAISNCNMRSGTYVDGLLVNAVKKGLAGAGK